MNAEVCIPIRSMFSAYLDGAVSGREMHEISQHMDGCADCRREFAALREMQTTLATLGPARAPADLAMKLRLAISHEQSNARTNWWDSFSLRWENTIRPFAVQLSAGFAGTIVLVGGIMLLLGMVAAPEPVMANDEPLGAMTSAHYLYSAVAPRAIETPYDTAVVVEAYVDALGRVYDYNIVAGPVDANVRNQIADQLMLSVFEPARVFGSPVRSRVVVTFSGISVRA